MSNVADLADRVHTENQAMVVDVANFEDITDMAVADVKDVADMEDVADISDMSDGEYVKFTVRYPADKVIELR